MPSDVGGPVFRHPYGSGWLLRLSDGEGLRTVALPEEQRRFARLWSARNPSPLRPVSGPLARVTGGPLRR